jgi:F420-dependent oxidoreductase-like protein
MESTLLSRYRGVDVRFAFKTRNQNSTWAEILAVWKEADQIEVYESGWNFDHFYPIYSDSTGPCLEGWTMLAALAQATTRLRLGTLVTGIHYRHPAVLANMASTIDIISGGRLELGIGAGWNEEESRGLGLFFPPTSERFERLEEALQIILQMWSDDESPYQGAHYQLGRTLNVPQPLTRPHPPILIGGGGEKKTLRLVAKYAQACNLFAGPEIAHKLEVLRGHCEAEGRDYDEIEKTAVFTFDVGPDGERVDETLAALRELADLGIQVAHGRVEAVHDPARLQVLGEKVVPIVAAW